MIFLDLEETIIEDFNDPLLVHVHKIKQFLGETKTIGIFSFAIWDDKDLRHFNDHIRPSIETALEVHIGPVPTVDKIMREIFWKHGSVLSRHEFLVIWGKQRAFIDWSLLTQTEDVVLIDDVVQNLVVHDKDRQLKIELINIDNL